MDEKYQSYILGGEWDDEWAPDRDRLRAEYFAKFPRNPELHHFFNTAEARQAQERGDTTMTALCGDTISVPQSWNPSTIDPVKPDEIDWDTEFEDDETGEWWVAMDCVNCLKVTNERRRVWRHQRLEELLAWFASHPELIPEDDAVELLHFLQDLHEQVDAD
ncbi:hypothetical protein CSX11_24190 [Mycobacterium goodii]|nr:hypothetical protein CSX11_24190 [Mycolicibacterium goodii]